MTIKPWPTLRGLLICLVLAILALIFIFHYLFTHRQPAKQIAPPATVPTTQMSNGSYRDGRGNLYNSSGNLEKPMSQNICDGDIPVDSMEKCE